MSLTEISSFSNFVVILDCPGQVSSPLPVNCHVYVWIFFLFSCSTACLVLSEVLLLEYFALEFSLGELMQGYLLLLKLILAMQSPCIFLVDESRYCVRVFKVSRDLTVQTLSVFFLLL